MGLTGGLSLLVVSLRLMVVRRDDADLNLALIPPAQTPSQKGGGCERLSTAQHKYRRERGLGFRFHRSGDAACRLAERLKGDASRIGLLVGLAAGALPGECACRRYFLR